MFLISSRLSGVITRASRCMMSSFYPISPPRALSVFNPKISAQKSPVFISKNTLHYEIPKPMKNFKNSMSSNEIIKPGKYTSNIRCFHSDSPLMKRNKDDGKILSVYDLALVPKSIPIFVPKKAPDFRLDMYSKYHGVKSICECSRNVLSKRHIRK